MNGVSASSQMVGGERLYFRDSNLDFERLVDSEKQLMIRKGQRFFGVYAGNNSESPYSLFSNVVPCKLFFGCRSAEHPLHD